MAIQGYLSSKKENMARFLGNEVDLAGGRLRQAIENPEFLAGICSTSGGRT
jgi:hypothetical protein